MGASGSCGANGRKHSARDAPLVIDPNLRGYPAGNESDYKPNEMKEIKITDTFNVVVGEFKGKFYAFGSKCPHYAAPLAKGALLDGIVKCPWHGAAFDIRNGEIEDHPGLCNIPCYAVSKSRNGEITVYPRNFGVHEYHKPLIGKMVWPNPKVFVILGSGAAGVTCAQTLREEGYNGRIVMVTSDTNLPYDRTRLSKVIGPTWVDIKLKEEIWFQEAQVEIILNSKCSYIDFTKELVFLDNSVTPLGYDQLLIATGLRPRFPSKGSGITGYHYKNVVSLYSLKDSQKIRELSEGKIVLIQGSGFIAMELLTSLHRLASHVVVVSRSKRPYSVVLGNTVGRVIQQFVIRKYENVSFIGCDAVKDIFANERGEVNKIHTLKRREVPCDVVILATGGENTTQEFLEPPESKIPDSARYKSTKKLNHEKDVTFKEHGTRPLDISSDGTIPVTEFMETCVAGVYAAGDIVRIPLNCAVLGWAQITHWGMAQKMGRIAALKALGIEESVFHAVPFFWTSVAGLNLRYVGFGEHFNLTMIFGDFTHNKFLVLYKRDWRVLAALTCNCDPLASRIAFDIQDGINFEQNFPQYILDVFPNPPIIGMDKNLSTAELPKVEPCKPRPKKSDDSLKAEETLKEEQTN